MNNLITVSERRRRKWGNRLYTKTIGPSTYMLGHIRSVGRLRASFYFIFWSSSSSSVSPFPETEYQKVKCFGHVRKRRTKVYRYYYIPFTIFYFLKFHLWLLLCVRDVSTLKKKKEEMWKRKMFWHDKRFSSSLCDVWQFLLLLLLHAGIWLYCLLNCRRYLLLLFSTLRRFFFSFVFLIARHVAVCEDDCRLFFFFFSFFQPENFF